MNRGFNLVESAIVLGVVGLLIGGIWAAASTVKTYYEANQLVSDIVGICDRGTNIWTRSLTAPGTGTTTTTIAANKAGVWPATWYNSSNTFLKPFGMTSATLESWNADATYGGRALAGVLDLNIYIPAKYCAWAVPKLLSKGNSAMIYLNIGEGWWTAGPSIGWLPYSGDPVADCALYNSPMHWEIWCSPKN